MISAPNSARVRISVFGRRNAGKSALVNALASQEVSIVSDVPGTTTDPVSKTMELLPLGPVLLTDTAGIDDEGDLGLKRIGRTLRILENTDIAVLALPCGAEALEAEKRVAAECSRMGIPLVTVRTKKDLAASFAATEGEHAVSARTGEGVAELLHRLAHTVPAERQKPLLDGLVRPGDVVLCIAPIDEAAPKGRLILPQQQAIREIIEGGATAAVCQPDGIGVFLAKMPAGAVKFAITDSQAFAAVDRALPKEIPLTSFSILFARAKGDLAVFDKGLEAVKTLRDGDTVLVAEGCTHLRQCGDIGSVKIPAWLGKFTSKKLRFVFASGGDFDLGRGEKPALVVHCGGCMLTRRSVMARLERCRTAGVPVVNYGLLIAYMHGIHADPATCMVAGRGTGDKDR